MSDPSVLDDPPPAILRADALRALGSFASPVSVGPARHAAGALLRALTTRFGDPGEAFEADVFRQCARLADASGASTLTARLVQKLAPRGGYAPGAERWHIDLDPTLPAREGHRLVRVYFGRGTQWIPDSALPDDFTRARSDDDAARLSARYRSAMDALDARSPHPYEVPSGATILYRGGLRHGAVHRAPPLTEARLILVVSAWDGLP